MTIDWNKPLETIKGDKVVLIHRGKNHTVTDRHYYIVIAYDDGDEEPLVVNEQGSIVSDTLKQPCVRNARTIINWSQPIKYIDSQNHCVYVTTTFKFTKNINQGYIVKVTDLNGYYTGAVIVDEYGYTAHGDHIIANK